MAIISRIAQIVKQRHALTQHRIRFDVVSARIGQPAEVLQRMRRTPIVCESAKASEAILQKALCRCKITVLDCDRPQVVHRHGYSPFVAKGAEAGKAFFV